ncbi:MAG: hypothetical protein IJK27_00195 [Bacilli bacterium]|nr:hypothetical protein [Bacilli bacterium]
MSKEIYLVIGISVLVLLLITFIVSFVLYVKTPAPKGCEDMKISEEKCASCSHSECSFYKKEGQE